MRSGQTDPAATADREASMEQILREEKREG